LLHLNSLERGSLSATRSMLGGAASTTIVEAGLFSQGSEIVRSAILAPVKTVLLITALVSIVVTASRNKEERLELLVLLSCAAPLLSLVIYRNAFPYFFPFIVPPGMLLVGWLGDRQAWPRLGLPIAASLMVAWAVFVAFLWSSHGQMVQRQTIAAVHRMFPQPVVYIDRSGMIASFPRRGFFMSTWGMLNYHKGPPIFSEILSRETVPLLIISGPALNESAGLIAGVPDQLRLYPQDEKVLQQNYIQHWGRIWVAGKRLDANPEPSTFRVMIPGRYTVEGAPASIDGRALPPGATVDLERGLHSVKSATPQILTLRWGNHLYRPANAPLPGPMYRGF